MSLMNVINCKSAIMLRKHILRDLNSYQTRILIRAATTRAAEPIKVESNRMKQFHEKLKLQSPPRVNPAARFVDLVLVETDSKGELIANSEKDPTKWGDWQTNGRVTDF